MADEFGSLGADAVGQILALRKLVEDSKARQARGKMGYAGQARPWESNERQAALQLDLDRLRQTGRLPAWGEPQARTMVGFAPGPYSSATVLGGTAIPPVSSFGMGPAERLESMMRAVNPGNADLRASMAVNRPMNVNPMVDVPGSVQNQMRERFAGIPSAPPVDDTLRQLQESRRRMEEARRERARRAMMVAAGEGVPVAFSPAVPAEVPGRVVGTVPPAEARVAVPVETSAPPVAEPAVVPGDPGPARLGVDPRQKRFPAWDLTPEGREEMRHLEAENARRRENLRLQGLPVERDPRDALDETLDGREAWPVELLEPEENLPMAAELPAGMLPQVEPFWQPGMAITDEAIEQWRLSDPEGYDRQHTIRNLPQQRLLEERGAVGTDAQREMLAENREKYLAERKGELARRRAAVSLNARARRAGIPPALLVMLESADPDDPLVQAVLFGPQAGLKAREQQLAARRLKATEAETARKAAKDAGRSAGK